ncbi:MAG: hypothetical protein O2960_24125 [Verrucomicrobia bacterium]|nr:hypothetical protein [Verrucomicrobiota bacterium]
MATLLFSGRDWLLPVVALLAAALLGGIWSYRRAPVRSGFKVVAGTLKILGVLALAACLLEPLWTGTRARPGENLFLVLIDNSQGMQIRDRGESKYRSEILRDLIRDDRADWQLDLNETFDVRRYLFDSRVHAIKDLAPLTFEGRSSSIGTALQTLKDRYQGRPLAGILLFSDGNATDIPDGSIDLSGLPPIYPVLIGKNQPSHDISLDSVNVTQTSFEDAPVTINAKAFVTGYPGTNIVARLFDPSGKKVMEQTEKSGSDEDAISFRFQFRPEKSGISFYRLSVSAYGENEQFDDPGSSVEATLANNSQMIVVDRGKGPFRILYVSGRPNWEFKFLNRALSEDDQIQLVGLIRIANREPKFEFRGHQNESANPLFRGFDKADAETERYDQPVLIRLNVRDDTELLGGFPKTAEGLFGYHAVILDDLESEFFTHDQMVLLRRFVSERGGGFLMLGGQESFQEGKYDRTPIGDLLPVYLDRVPESAENFENIELRLSLTREGWLQPWTRLRKTEDEENARLKTMPSFQVLNPIRAFKPGASALSSVRDSNGTEYPALIVQRFGHGRSAALAIGDLWRWGLRSAELQKDLAKSWRQTARWLIADVPPALDLRAEPKEDGSQSVLLQLRVRDKEYQPMDNASVSVDVQTAPVALNIEPKTSSGQSTDPNVSIRIQGEPALSEAGMYESTYVGRTTGAYKAVATVTDASGLEVGRAEVGWTADPAADEFRSLKPNRGLLEKIAKQSGGEMVGSDRLNEFAKSMPNRSVPITDAWSFPLWHTSVVFLFALACFVAEWGLRRWKGLA